MDKKGKIIFALTLLVIALLISFSIIVSKEIATLRHQINTYANAKPEKIDTQELAKQVANHIEVPNVKDGIDGKNGADGEDGLDSVSTHTVTEKVIEKETVIQEQVPLIGKEGKQGERDHELKLQLNPLTNNLEMRYSDSSFWEVLIPCEKLIVSSLCTKVGL